MNEWSHMLTKMVHLKQQKIFIVSENIYNRTNKVKEKPTKQCLPLQGDVVGGLIRTTTHQRA